MKVACLLRPRATGPTKKSLNVNITKYITEKKAEKL